MNEMEQKVLKTLSHQYKTQAAASTEIINLQSILNLPKGTEHFLTDIHGEYEQFNHVLKNGSGSVRRKIDEEFGNTISSKDKKSLATLIYYPESKLEIVEREEDNLEDWYKISLHRLVQVIKRVSCLLYTSGFTAKDEVTIILKNIAAQELSASGEELTERFVRGDASRNTEGSGLGLAIAKSFTEIQGGKFRIELDGDLFKVVLIWKVKQENKEPENANSAQM